MTFLKLTRGAAYLAAFLSLCGAAGASTYSSAVQALSPLSYWQFAEASGVAGTPIAANTVSVNSGSLATNGTYQNGSSVVGTGIPTNLFPGMTGTNQSVNFVAANAITGSDAGLPTGNATLTWTGWVSFTNGGGSGYSDVFSYGSPGANQMLFTLVPPWVNDTNLNGTGTANGIPGNFGVSQYGDGVGTTTSLNSGGWHFLAFTLNNQQYDLYVDGALAASKVMGTNFVPSGTYWIGNDSLVDPYFGQMAHQAVFGTALTANQISGLYQAAVPEPASLTLLGLGAIGLFFAVRRRRAAK